MSCFQCAGFPFQMCSENTSATSPSEIAGQEETQDNMPLVVKEFHVQLHSAELSRSFAKVGWMDPYAIVVLGDDAQESGRTQTAKGAHKKPVWESDLTVATGSMPDSVTVAVWDKNTFHKDVFCGSTTVPCAPDMGVLEKRDFILTKKDKPTGQIKITLRVVLDESSGRSQGSPDEMLVSKPSSGCLEFDSLAAWARLPSGTALAMKQGENWAAQGTGDNDEAEHKASEKKSSAPIKEGLAGPLIGKWKCVDTWGLDEFLKAQKRSYFERKMASSAKWPDWEFKVEGSEGGDKVIFMNNTMIGLLTEDIFFDKEYEYVDGQKNAWKVAATWMATDAGGTLIMERTGSVCTTKEERVVNGDKLTFTLTSGGVSWGRSFERD